MNTNRVIEGTTLMTIGVFCASVIVSFALHSSPAYAAHNSQVAVFELPAVTITAKHLSAAEKLTSLREEQAAVAQ